MSTDIAARIQHELLPRISKPNRYLGEALQPVPKPEGQVAVRVLLAFPDAFEIGFSNLGIRILHHVVNQRPDAVAELVFAPWPDAEAEMRRLGLPLFSLESHRPAGEFDLLGFSLQYELQYTNVLTMLDLAGLPLRSIERDERHPLVVAGGAQAFSPEPMAEFIDAFVAGDGEEVVQRIVDLVKQARAAGWPRAALLRRLARVPGVYVSRGYATALTPEGRLVPRARPGFPARVESVWVAELRREYYPETPLLPVGEITHDRLSVEIMRGCTRSRRSRWSRCPRPTTPRSANSCTRSPTSCARRGSRSPCPRPVPTTCRPTWRGAWRPRRRARSRSPPRRAASGCATPSTRTTPRRSC